MDVLRLAQLHNQTDKVHHEMNTREKVIALEIDVITVLKIVSLNKDYL